MKRLVCMLALVCALATSGQGFAQPVPAPNPTPHALDLAKQYMAAIDLPKQMDAVMGSVAPQLIANSSAGRAITPAQTIMITKAAQESIASFAPKMEGRMAEQFADLFTEQELQALVDFYSSPEGRSITAKVAQATPLVLATLSDLIPQMQADMARRICEQTSCDAKPSRPQLTS